MRIRIGPASLAVFHVKYWCFIFLLQKRSADNNELNFPAMNFYDAAKTETAKSSFTKEPKKKPKTNNQELRTYSW